VFAVPVRGPDYLSGNGIVLSPFHKAGRIDIRKIKAAGYPKTGIRSDYVRKNTMRPA